MWKWRHFLNQTKSRLNGLILKQSKCLTTHTRLLHRDSSIPIFKPLQPSNPSTWNTEIHCRHQWPMSAALQLGNCTYHHSWTTSWTTSFPPTPVNHARKWEKNMKKHSDTWHHNSFNMFKCTANKQTRSIAQIAHIQNNNKKALPNPIIRKPS